MGLPGNEASHQGHNKIRKVWNEESRTLCAASGFSKMSSYHGKQLTAPQKSETEFKNEHVIFLWAWIP